MPEDVHSPVPDASKRRKRDPLSGQKGRLSYSSSGIQIPQVEEPNEQPVHRRCVKSFPCLQLGEGDSKLVFFPPVCSEKIQGPGLEAPLEVYRPVCMMCNGETGISTNPPVTKG